MESPARVSDICAALYDRHKDLAHGDDEERRQLTRLIAEQVCYELGPSWGTKRADPGRPPSKDGLACQTAAGRLFVFDWQNGETRQANPPGEMEDITGQVFIAVSPVNHLGDAEPVPEPPEPGPTPAPCRFQPTDLSELERELAALRGEIAILTVMVQVLLDRPDPSHPAPPIYDGRVPMFGGNVTLTPRPPQ